MSDMRELAKAAALRDWAGVDAVLEEWRCSGRREPIDLGRADASAILRRARGEDLPQLDDFTAKAVWDEIDAPPGGSGVRRRRDMPHDVKTSPVTGLAA